MSKSVMTSTGSLETIFASKYLQQLCKHFAHKVEVTFDDEEGRAALPPGPATMRATETGLHITIIAETEAGLAQARHIIDSHLVRFAHRENFTSMRWSDAAETESAVFM